MTTLKGMTWRHPRGYDPMVATSRVWRDRTGVEIVWDQRSLQDFESFPVEELARAYDLIVIDHPHVGQITAQECLVPLDVAEREAERDALARGSVGQSYASYNWKGKQWAFPIDAAAQVQIFRPDRLSAPITRWSEALDLARAGEVILPLRAPHALMCFFTLAANLGTPCNTGVGEEIIPVADGTVVIDMLAEIAALVPEGNFDMDPIAASEAMAEAGSPFSLMPLGYGYVSYAREGFRDHMLGFADIPDVDGRGPTGSALGGTGIAVSAFGQNIPAALDYAYWVAGAEVQRTLYAQSGGQPGHAAGWEDDAVNAGTGGFYRATRATLDGAWVRPRHNGYMGFQKAASERIAEGLQAGDSARAIIDAINKFYRESF